MLAQGEVQCPISLDTAPLCPQITPCGHVFAFPSIMQHLITHGGDQLRKTSPCPLCYSQIAARELRMVRVYHVARPEVGSTRVWAAHLDAMHHFLFRASAIRDHMHAAVET